MAKTLIASKPILEQELKKILYEAFFKQFLSISDASISASVIQQGDRKSVV